MEKVSIKQLRKQVEMEREMERKRLEKQKLKKELFKLKNPKLVATVSAFGRGAKLTGKALGKGTVNVVKSLQEHAERQQKVSRPRLRRVKTKRKMKVVKTPKLMKTKLVPIQRGGRTVSFQQVPVRTLKAPKIKRRKKRKVVGRKESFFGESSFGLPDVPQGF